jgi:hypothetical protein
MPTVADSDTPVLKLPRVPLFHKAPVIGSRPRNRTGLYVPSRNLPLSKHESVYPISPHRFSVARDPQDVKSDKLEGRRRHPDIRLQAVRPARTSLRPAGEGMAPAPAKRILEMNFAGL